MERSKFVCSVCGRLSEGYDEKNNYSWCAKHKHIPPRYIEEAIKQHKETGETNWDKYHVVEHVPHVSGSVVTV